MTRRALFIRPYVLPKDPGGGGAGGKVAAANQRLWTWLNDNGAAARYTEQGGRPKAGRRGAAEAGLQLEPRLRPEGPVTDGGGRVGGGGGGGGGGGMPERPGHAVNGARDHAGRGSERGGGRAGRRPSIVPSLAGSIRRIHAMLPRINSNKNVAGALGSPGSPTETERMAGSSD